MTSTTYKKVGIAAMIMMASVFLSRIIGVVREMVIANIGGVGGGVDAYQVAFVIPEILNHVVASGFLSISFIPIFSKYLTQGREEEGWRVFSLILVCFGSFLIILIGLAEIFADPLVSLFAPGLDSGPTKAAAVEMTRIVIPAQFFFFCGGLFMAVQFTKERFFLPALAPIFYNLGIIIGGVLLGPTLGMPGFAWGVLGGGFLGNFVVQYVGAQKAGLRFTWPNQVLHPDLKEYLRLTLPLMLGLTPVFSMEIFFRFFGSFLPTGSIASINYSLRIMSLLVGLCGQAIGTAVYPFMTRLVTEKKLQDANALLNSTLKYVTLSIPMCVMLMALRRETVFILFERGRFDAAATAATAQILLFLLPGAVAIATYTIVVRGFYAGRNTLFPAIFCTIGALLTLPCYLFGIKVMGAAGIGLAMSLSAFFQVILLYMVWNKRSHNQGSLGVYLSYFKMIGIGAGLFMLLEWLRPILSRGLDTDTIVGNLALFGLMGVIGSGLLMLIGHLFSIPEILEPTRRIGNKLSSAKVFNRN